MLLVQQKRGKSMVSRQNESKVNTACSVSSKPPTISIPLMIIVIMMMIMITPKGTIEDFFSLLTPPQTFSNMYVQVA